MRLHITLKIPGRNGAHSQYVICDHEAADIDEFNDLLNEQDHVVVTELNTDRETGELVPGSRVSLNHHHIAKVTQFAPRRLGMRD